HRHPALPRSRQRATGAHGADRLNQPAAWRGPSSMGRSTLACMPSSDKPYVIAIEEHYADPAVMARGDGRGGRDGALVTRLTDLGELRLREMDSAGIDLQVISHAPSPLQQLEPAEARQVAVQANDRLHDAVDRNPERFAAFA